MFDFTLKENIGKSYKDFVLLKIDDLTEKKAKGIYLRHKFTGLEVYHIYCKDKENLFSFAFRTIAKNNYGTAHILEHSCLCGSEKYPLKEPYSTLSNQSINTFLNAMTYPDKTVFPAASLVRKDYYNMMDVYADAVFFPKLKETTFLQEGHRLELDKNSKATIQGVVYNEMQGNYSSFYQVAYSKLVSAMFPDSYPCYDAGGDPIEIPNINIDDLIDFHKKYYTPDNCLLFLYGDIPTIEQIDYLSKELILRLQKKYNATKIINNYDSVLPLVKNEILDLQKLNLRKENSLIKTNACLSGATNNFVTRNWYLGEYCQEHAFLSGVLCGNDSSPISKLLIDSGLGDEVLSGVFGQFTEQFFTLGLNGVKKGNEQKVFNLIEKLLIEFYNNPISQKEIESSIMNIDYSLREINRYYGPSSIILMEQVLKSWTFGFELTKRLSPISKFESIKKEIQLDKDYTKKLIEKFLIKNPIHIDFICEPSIQYDNQRIQKQNELLTKLLKQKSLLAISEQNTKLHAELDKKESVQELSIIPHTKISELDLELVNIIDTKIEFIQNTEGNNIPFFINEVDTNGVFYIDVCYPFDNLEPKYLQHIPMLTELVTSIGWNNKPWDECLNQASCIMGDAYCGLILDTVPKSKECLKESQKYKELNIQDRNWLTISCKTLSSYAKQSLELLSQIITKTDFTDAKRFKAILNVQVSDRKGSIVPNGMFYTNSLAKVFKTYNTTLKEILFGLTQLKTFKEYTKVKPKKLLNMFSKIYCQIIDNGGIIHITSDKDSINNIKPLLKDFVINTNIKTLQNKKEYSVKDLMPFVYSSSILQDNFAQNNIKLNCQTSYSSVSLPGSDYMTKEYASQMLLAYYLNTHSLWEKIRAKGGAYGVNCEVDATNQLFTMSTYRDPNPQGSIKVFFECLQDLLEEDILEEELEKTKVSYYAEKICPETPRQQANDSFELLLYGNSKELLKKRVMQVFSVTSQDLKQAIQKLLQDSKNYCKKAVFCDKRIKTSGNIIKIPL